MCDSVWFDVHIGADLKERAQMDNSESDLFVHSLRALMTHIGEKKNKRCQEGAFIPPNQVR